MTWNYPINNPVSIALRVLGVAAVIIAAWFAFSNINVAAIDGVQDCGAPFTTGSDVYATAGSAVQAQCTVKRHDHEEYAIVAFLVGACLVVGGIAASRTVGARS